tara:strand:+ start:45 stop:446 length:402 start_codon:yes stop_codon:yes gene_type:complete
MQIKQTTFNKNGPIHIQDHGEAYIVSYPSELAGYQEEKVFSKGIGVKAWQAARAFAKDIRDGYVIGMPGERTLKELRQMADAKGAKVETQRYADGWGYWLLNKDGTDIYPDGNYHNDHDSLEEAVLTLPYGDV